eukprot:g6765.t1
MALVLSSFKEVLMIDADSPYKSQEQESGQLLVDKARVWREINLALHLNAHNYMTRNAEHGDLAPFKQVMVYPSHKLKASAMWTRDVFGADSGALVVDKVRQSRMMEVLRRYYLVMMKRTYGDKEAFWLAAELAGSEYAFSKFAAGLYGTSDNQGGRTYLCGGDLAHFHPDTGKLLFFHGDMIKENFHNTDVSSVTVARSLRGDFVKLPGHMFANCMKGPVRRLTASELAAITKRRSFGFETTPVGMPDPNTGERPPPPTMDTEDASGYDCSAHDVLYPFIDTNLKPHFDRGIVQTQEEHLESLAGVWETIQKKRGARAINMYTVAEIVGNRLYCVPQPGVKYKYHSVCYPPGANFNRVSFVLDLINRTLAHHTVPDSQLLISTNDVPLGDKYIFAKGAIPKLFALGKSDRELDIVLPGQTFTMGDASWPKWLSAENQALMDEKYPWKSKKEVAFWRGHEQSNLPLMTPLRLKLSLTTQNDSLYDIDLVGGYDPNRKKYADKVDMLDHAKWKYLVHIDGSTVSSRYMKLLAVNSVVFKHESVWYEYFEAALKPHKHFVPFHFGGDLEAMDEWDGNHENLTAQLEWAKANDEEVRAIGARGRAFAIKHLSVQAAQCYIARLLNKYAKLFKGPFTVSPGAEAFGWGSLFTDEFTRSIMGF